MTPAGPLTARGEQGFTLVELLAAMVGAALLLGALAAMTGLLAGRLLAPVAAPDLLASQMSLNALAERIVPDPANSALEQASSDLSLILLPPAASGTAEPLRARLLVIGARGDAALVLRPEGTTDNEADQIIAAGWQQIDLRPQWRRPASAAPAAPPVLAAIRVELTASDGAAHQLIAATRIDSSAACLFDLISQSCRP